MSRTYKANGIILKGMPLGEADRLVTILTPEFGLIRAVVPGARKIKSRLRGRTELFVVSELLLIEGRSLHKIIGAETIHSYPGLSQDLAKLAASQYLAELVLSLALSEQPQAELYELLLEHLRRIEELSKQENIFAPLAQAMFHLLAIAGIAPQVHSCCLSQKIITANFNDPHWRVGFSFDSGGIVNLSTRKTVQEKQIKRKNEGDPETQSFQQLFINERLNAIELTLLQLLGENLIPKIEQILPQKNSMSVEAAWLKVEQLLREYSQHHCGRSFRSAALIDAIEPVQF